MAVKMLPHLPGETFLFYLRRAQRGMEDFYGKF